MTSATWDVRLRKLVGFVLCVTSPLLLSRCSKRSSPQQNSEIKRANEVARADTSDVKGDVKVDVKGDLGDASPPRADAVSVPSTSASLAEKPLKAPKGPTPAHCPDFERSMRKAQSLLTAKDYVGAEESYRKAIAAAPFRAQAWAELGFNQLLAGQSPIESLLAARSLTTDPTLLSMIWFNEGLWFERKGETENAQVRFAVSAELGNVAAKKRVAKAGPNATCTVTWSTKALGDIPWVTGWKDVVSKMAQPICLEQREAKATELEAHKEACRGCVASDDKLTSFACTGSGPWTIPNGYMHCHLLSVSIQEVTTNKFVVHDYDDGNKPALYAKTPFGYSLTDRHPAPDHHYTEVELNVMVDKATAVDGCPVDLAAEVDLETPNHCGAGEALAPIQGLELRKMYNADGKGLIDFTIYHGNPTVTIADGKAKLLGAGCDVVIPL